ncbi:F-actin-capping protein subunit beta [Tritrichomonas foetus]|uniref:F-actin-capping protein subunit beta n=1 Tax=Tritrichomonas foetus TaxID=1144522 RepID=A0A1J4JJL0_9EUKA|nr:F-actin-capping protein subunit beta [Tritrichomonas foetus]|eukprot:OHS99344.1 F-actin-capping protein subunit beta [Tritrichomonas foetus]
MTYSSKEEAGRDLLRHVDPKHVEDRMYDIIHIEPSVTESLLETVDVPLKVGTDEFGIRYIQCDYNRDGDSFRSPKTNKYYPPLKDGLQLPENLREMEIMANKGFSTYLRHYFDRGTCSVYCWEVDDAAFGVGVFILKDNDDVKFGSDINGSISCTDVCEVRLIDEAKQLFQYTLVSSTIVDISWKCPSFGAPEAPVSMNGSMNDQHVKTARAQSNIEHLVTIGEMVESSSDRFVEKIRQIYVSKMEEILSYMKSNPNGISADALAVHAKAFQNP